MGRVRPIVLGVVCLVLLLAPVACGKARRTPTPAPTPTRAALLPTRTPMAAVAAPASPAPTATEQAVAPLPPEPAVNAEPTGLVQPGNSPLAAPTPIDLYGRTDFGLYRLGSAEAEVVVHEYLDPLCPDCRKHVLEVLPAVVDTYVKTGLVQLVFQPVLDLNPGSQASAEAAYCAGHQRPELFWSMVQAVFLNHQDLAAQGDTKPALKRMASEIGVDQALFDTCLEGQMFAGEVTALDDARRKAGILERPSFLIFSPAEPAGRLVTGLVDSEGFIQLLTAALGQ